MAYKRSLRPRQASMGILYRWSIPEHLNVLDTDVGPTRISVPVCSNRDAAFDGIHIRKTLTRRALPRQMYFVINWPELSLVIDLEISPFIYSHL